VPTSFVALAVVVLAILPGAVYLMAFESRSGPYKVSVPDRLIRFLVASAAIHALVAGLTYYLYKKEVLSENLASGKTSAWAVELAALTYTGLPYVAGLLIGTAYADGWPGVRWLHREAWHPRAWDHIFSQRRVSHVRLRLKSGDWVGGMYAKIEGSELGGYASAYGEEPDLYLNPSLVINRETGEFKRDDDGRPVFSGGAILVRWAEVEYAQFIH
jgi:uncharacterized protein DUF6338